MARKLMLSMLVVLMTGLHCYSQAYPKIEVLGKDTVVVFSKDQVRELAILRVRHDMYKSLSDSLYENSLIMQKKIEIQGAIIDNLKDQLSAYDSLTQNFESMNKAYELIIIDKDKELRSLRKKNWIVVGAMTLISIIAILK